VILVLYRNYLFSVFNKNCWIVGIEHVKDGFVNYWKI